MNKPIKKHQTMTVLPLPSNPYLIFKDSRTPFGLYARQKWFGEASSRRWQEEYAIVVAALRDGQSDDGLWQGAALATIQRLFGLHLTVRRADPSIERALEALITVAGQRPAERDQTNIASAALEGLPFAPARRRDVVLPATLFLGAIFGQTSDRRWVDLYEESVSSLTTAPLAEQDPAALHNFLRAFVVHPVYADHDATGRLVRWLADRQRPQGHWGAEIPFHQALNALAHLNTPAAVDQCRKAFDRLVAKQNADGSWGQDQREWRTFLVVHALRNKGVCPPYDSAQPGP
jgi:hypothetical protein